MIKTMKNQSYISNKQHKQGVIPLSREKDMRVSLFKNKNKTCILFNVNIELN